MTALLSIHLLALGIWIGVVGAEFAIEFDGMKDDESAMRAAKMHYATDVWIEIPAFLTVFITGAMMVETWHLSGLFLVKIIFGLLAICFNFLSVYTVFKRRKYALAGDIEGMKSLQTLTRIGGLIIPVFLIAFGLGVYFIAVG